MRRFILFAALQWFGIMAFCQSMAPAPATARTAPEKQSASQPLFHLNSGQFGPFSSSAESMNIESISGPNANQIFKVPHMNPNTFPEIAHMNLPTWPNGKLEPIPTQWPNAKIEQIPIIWPHLSMQQISSVSVPTR